MVGHDGDAYTAERVRLLRAFGTKLRAERDRLNVSQETLAEIATVHRTHLAALERGRREPHLSMLLVLADALEVPRQAARGKPVAGPVPQAHHLEMLRLRILDGLPLTEISKRAGVNPERVRQALSTHFGVRGKPAAATARTGRHAREASHATAIGRVLHDK
jgi:DNA-binding XRE family transcriptional regulator